MNMKSFMKNLLIVLALGTQLVALGNARAHAQALPAATQLHADVAGGFTVIHANEGPANCGCFWMYGGSGGFSVTNSRNISFVTNVGYTSQTNINNNGRNLALLTALEGARYTFDHGQRITPFGQASVGIAHTDTNLRIDNGVTRFAMAVGGGVDMHLTHRLAFRPIEAEYLFSTVPNGQNNFQNQLRLTAGVVFRLNK
jgi:opacity protein-like surface antigen